jgi:hypothetical protein
MKTGGTNFVDLKPMRLLFLSLTLLFFLSCEKESLDPSPESVEVSEEADLKAKHDNTSAVYEFSAPVYDIAAAPDGSILVGLNEGDTRKIQQIKNGSISTMIEFQSATAIQGIASIGAGNAFVTTAGGNLAEHGELYRVSNGNAQMVADLAAYERQNDPDANLGFQWKDQLCEAIDGFDAGPQNNPFNVVALDGG